MTISKIEENGKIILKIEGWLDVQTTQELDAFMEKLEPSRELVYDFTDLEYISSAGVREVIAAFRRQKDAGGEFSVINVSQEIMDVFSMTGINKKINIIPAQKG